MFRKPLRAIAAAALIAGLLGGTVHLQPAEAADEQSISRGAFIQALVTALKLLPEGAGHTAEDYASAAQQAGLLSAPGSLTAPMTRSEAAKLTVIAAKKDVIWDGKVNRDESKWMFLAMENGLLSSYAAKDRLGLRAGIPAKQADTIIGRVGALKAGQTLPVDKRAMSVAEVQWHRTNLLTMFHHYLYDVYDANGKVVGSKKGKYNQDPELKYGQRDYVLTSPTKQYSAELTGMYIIDLNDPNDPFRDKIPTPLNKLYWTPNQFDSNYVTIDGKKAVVRTKYPVSNYKDAYLIVLNQKVLRNELKFTGKQEGFNKMFNEGAIEVGFHGVADGPDDDKDLDAFFKAQKQGQLNMWEYIYTPVLYKRPPMASYEEMQQRSTKMYLIPKHTTSESSFNVDMFYGISGATYASRNLFYFGIDGPMNGVKSGDSFPIVLQ